ncbi:hypothetical protein CJD_A0353 [Clostridium perfringens D str. JGS1721]|uniref:Uncharacterized protein n=1 Tax=Clostridium perfringens D str. JGS1721 TaxID=488537 RepID=B1V6U0_CLOPF|nr:hypothetical protein [Clostridium perfringens]EDT70481.1 hypothetical protein CJD_A0353 [Clostridium perfringens D str. JGS1721]
MARLKKGEKKKVQMTIRIDPEVAEKLKSIDKYSAKMTAIISSGIDDYEKWLEDSIEHIKEDNEEKNKIKFSKETNFYELYDNKEFRENLVKRKKQELLNLDKENILFGQFHPEIMKKKYDNINKMIDFFESWECYCGDTFILNDPKGELFNNKNNDTLQVGTLGIGKAIHRNDKK